MVLTNEHGLVTALCITFVLLFLVLLTDRNEMSIFIDDLPRMLPTKFRFFWQRGFREEFFLEINQSETRIGNSCF
jgi:hypothetical protein